MIKKLSNEGRFEAGIDEIVHGKVWAFVPVFAAPAITRATSANVLLGVAIANEAGYYPVPWAWCHADDYGEMADHADELNRAQGLTDEEAARIALSTMRRVHTD